ncbi:MAG: 4Fe-4S dicluster domain-containing protein [Proteobacteria bacterium]|nr:4Fe-4S dicluster domain-containing protein [Pseudomonadota bacterium]MBU1716032.1 4Fe-4S dicluster domain-containing protein [Pseudomonadota bacterium]
MNEKRRKFLKIAGLSAVAGLGAPSAFNLLLKGEVHASSSAVNADPHATAKAVAPTGKRLGMAIDINKFAKDKDLAQRCINACHSIHNVPDYGNPKDEIKWIWTDKFENVFPDHSQYKKNDALHKMDIVTLCNHCNNPPCVRACPTKATFKNLETGAVLMDFHRCIGCRFCMAACPYGARSFNWRSPREMDKDGNYKFIKHVNLEFPTRMRGVVEKCNLCSERLAEGKEPACVEACRPTDAMVFGDLNDPNSPISKLLNDKFSIQRKPALGTLPSVFYII